MSAVVTLTLRAALEQPIDVERLTPDACIDQSALAIASLPAWVGSRRASLGDFFDVRGGDAPAVRVEGDLSRVHGLGAGMTRGELLLVGDAGHRVGAGMSGGFLTVRGRIGDEGGQAMSGGVLRVHGQAGHRLGASLPGAARGMTGGEIVVDGHVGDEAAWRARRGLVVVGQDSGARTGGAMIAGTVVVFGRVGPDPAGGSKRGTLVAIGEVAVPVSYAYACTFEPPFVRLLLTHLRRRYGMDVHPQWRDGLYRRYCGDAGTPGKGEILALAAAG